MEAKFWHGGLERNAVQCDLCPRRCVIAEGRTGFCHVRRNRAGRLIAETWERPAALQVDPIEKKPLAFYRPGTRTFSVGTFGCNLGCRFCQNDHLSRHGMEDVDAAKLPVVPAAQIVDLACRCQCESVALTYNEPTVFLEYGMAILQAARERKLGTVLVSNGYIEAAPRREFYPLVEAANIDVKGFGSFYESLCSGTLPPVLESCRYFKRELGGHLEITNLLIPGCNDSRELLEAFLDWAAEELGVDTVLHFSAYFPAGGFRAPATPAETVLRACDMAAARGFERVLTGNLRLRGVAGGGRK